MAMVFNGTSQRSIATLSTPLAGGVAFSAALTFKTGSTLLAWQRILSLQSASGLPYGFGFGINSSGNFVGIYNNNGAELSTTSLGAAAANTIYRAVITKDAGQFGHFKCYLNAIGTTVTATNVNDLTALARYTFGARISGSVSEYFGGKEARIALFDSVLSSADISVCLNPNTTPVDASVSPIYYWDAVANGNATIGSVNLTLVNSVTFDSDTLISVIVSSINGGNAITAGKTSIASVSTGFTGLPTTITTNASGVTCSNIGGSTNAATFDISDRVDAGLYPKSGTSVNFTFANGGENAALAQAVVKKANETVVAISSPLFSNNTLAQAILDQTGRTVATGDEFYHTNYSDLVITADTDFTVTDAGSFDLWLYVSSGADAGKMFYYAVTITESGAVVVPPTTRPLGGRPIRSSLGRQIWPITPHATNPVGGSGETKKAYGIKVSGAGTVVIRTEGGDEDVTITLAAGATLPVVVTHVRDTSTATGILGYSIY